MLVCDAGAHLSGAFVIPATAHHGGLFWVARESALLISNAISFECEVDVDLARRSWLKGIADVLRQHVPAVWFDRDVTWGLYSAVKSEIVCTSQQGVPGGGIFDANFQNVRVVVPGKLVNAPVYARLCVESVLKSGVDLAAPCLDMDDARAAFDRLGWSSEAWQSVRRFTRAELFGMD